MPKFFLFPSYQAPLIRIAAIALVLALVAWGLMGAILDGSLMFPVLVFLLVYFVTAVILARYGFTVIERTSTGYLNPKIYPEHFEQGSPYRPYKLWAILVLVPVGIIFIGMLFNSSVLPLLMFIVFALLLPAAVMVLTMTDSFFEAVNPVRCMEVAQKIGKPYLVLCLFLFLLMIGSGQALELALSSATPDVSMNSPEAMEKFGSREALVSKVKSTVAVMVFLYSFIGNYFYLLMCVLIGYVMFQYSGELGIAVVGPGEARTLSKLTAGQHARKVREAMIGQMVAAGELREAMDLMNDELRDRPYDLALHARFHKMLLMEGSGPRIEDHTERYLDLLMKSDNLREALPLVEEAFGRNASYEPRKLEHVARLGRAAVEAGKPELATKLIKGFDKKHKMHPEIPNVYVVGALVLMQGGRMPEAERVLQHLIGQFPETAAASEGKRLLQRIAQLNSGGPKTA